MLKKFEFEKQNVINFMKLNYVSIKEGGWHKFDGKALW